MHLMHYAKIPRNRKHAPVEMFVFSHAIASAIKGTYLFEQTGTPIINFGIIICYRDNCTIFLATPACRRFNIYLMAVPKV
jgi:hypothetical protein